MLKARIRKTSQLSKISVRQLIEVSISKKFSFNFQILITVERKTGNAIDHIISLQKHIKFV